MGNKRRAEEATEASTKKKAVPSKRKKREENQARYGLWERVQSNILVRGSRGHVTFLLLLFVVLIGLSFYLLTNAYRADKERKFESRYGLQKYDEDQYAGELTYDSDGYAETADIGDAGLESDAWDEGVGIYNELRDASGQVVWPGISSSDLEQMSDEERDAVYASFREIEETIVNEGSLSNDLNQDTVLSDLLYHGTVRENITSLCVEFDGLIPFSYQGRSYALGFDKQISGYDNSVYPVGRGYGLDSFGYVVWVFRNAAGHTPEALKEPDPFSPATITEISCSELKVGDICSYYDIGTTDGNVLGVVAGFRDGVPVVSMADNRATKEFPYGCNHLAYIESIQDEVLGDYPPEPFTCFYRLSELEEDSDEK